MNLGAFYTSKRIYRGALIWDAPIIAFAPSFIFYNTVSLGPGGLALFKRVNQSHIFTVGFSYFDDNEPSGPVIKLKNADEDFKNRRGATFESYFKYEYRLQRFFSAAFEYHKDLKRNKGNYLNFKLSTSIIPLVTFGGAFGLGDKANNMYVYGLDAQSGSGHIDYFANLVLPFLPWKGRLMLNYVSSNIVKSRNKSADYVRGLDHNEVFSAAMIWSF